MIGRCKSCGDNFILKLRENQCAACSGKLKRKQTEKKKSTKSERIESEGIADDVANAYYLRAYGISLDEYRTMVVVQNGRCGICGERPEYPKKLYVDHNHLTGKVRALLCNDCNTGLGAFKDNLDYLTSAFEYLSKFR